MLRNFVTNSFRLSLAAAGTMFLAGCDVDVKDPGKAPSVDIDVQSEPGRAPDVDVAGPDITVKKNQKTIDVPDVEVKTKEKTITVPDVDITVPDASANDTNDNQ